MLIQQNVYIILYTDDAFGNLIDGGSQGGHLIFLVDTHGNCNLLSWQSKRIKRIVRCTLAAEAIAMVEGVEPALYISTLMRELCPEIYKEIPIKIYTDNKSLHNALKSHKFVSDKRLRIDIGSLKEMLLKKEISQIHWVNKQNQLADCLTKIGGNILPLIEALQKQKITDPE